MKKTKWIRTAVIAAVSVIFVLSSPAVHRAEKVRPGLPLEEYTMRLDSLVPELMSSYRIPGVSMALVRGGKTVWTGAYGYADIEEGREMTADTVCRSESISKSVTAWGVMKLAEEGLIELDSPLAAYLKSWSLPESEYSEERVTIRQLLSGRSGMPLGLIGVHYPPEAENIPPLEEVLTQYAVLRREPGGSFFYSNTGYNLLELLIEEVTGRDFAEYMENEVLKPLGMNSSSFNWSPGFNPPVPDGHALDGSPIAPYVYPDKASGGLFSTAGDLAAFVSAGMTDYKQPGKVVLSAGSVQQIYTPEADITGYYGMVFDSYGFGHFIEELPGGVRAVSHGGQGSGWMSQFHSVPAAGEAIVIQANSQRSWPFIASIFKDWGAWIGLRSVGMAVILEARKAVLVLMGVIVFLSLMRLQQLGRGLISGDRSLAPFSGYARRGRIVQAAVSAVIISGLLYILSLNYFFLSSVFPALWPRMAAALFIAAAALMLAALLPKTGNRKQQRLREA